MVSIVNALNGCLRSLSLVIWPEDKARQGMTPHLDLAFEFVIAEKVGNRWRKKWTRKTFETPGLHEKCHGVGTQLGGESLFILYITNLAVLFTAWFKRKSPVIELV